MKTFDYWQYSFKRISSNYNGHCHFITLCHVISTIFGGKWQSSTASDIKIVDLRQRIPAKSHQSTLKAMKEPLWMAPINTIKKNIAYTPLSSNSTRDLMTVSALARHIMNSMQLTLALGKLAAKLTEPDVIVPLINCQGWKATTNSFCHYHQAQWDGNHHLPTLL